MEIIVGEVIVYILLLTSLIIYLHIGNYAAAWNGVLLLAVIILWRHLP